AERARRGRLKLYVGYAPGAGKTWRLLQEARALRSAGVDAVLAVADARGRAETAALAEGLEAVPQRKVEFRGVVAEELDVDALLRRAPAVAIVDDVPHTNAPGSRNRRRYEDVLEIVAAGIDVVGALDAQHLESLVDLVARSAGVTVRETVPDGFLERADEVVSLDLGASDLLARLEAGKIYPAERVAWARQHGFQPAALGALRELALREVAESLDRSAARRPRGEPRRERAAGRVMVCLSSNPPHALALLRRGSRMAGRLNTSWYVVFVETPREAPRRIAAGPERHLAENVEKARELGADVVRLRSTEPGAALLAFARSHGVRDVLLGRTRVPWWRRLLGPSVFEQLVRGAEGLDLHIVSFVEEEPRP
ncbi:MAG TPA: universal stress protein, partial [Anaeromyxobacteraceae bacterium]|nr:universal stress protein [Anaeromyxobacteraceae bacterium]